MKKREKKEKQEKNVKEKSKTKRTKIIFIILLLIIVVLVGIIGALLYFFTKDDIKVNKDLTAEINEEVKLLSFVNNPKNDTITTKDKIIDTSKLGEQELVVEYTNKLNIAKELKFKIKVVDTTKPEIKVDDVITVELNSNIKIEDKVIVTDNSKQIISPKIAGTYDLSKEGQYKLKAIAEDLSGNKASKEFTLKITGPKIKNSGYYVYKMSDSEHGMQFRADGSVEYDANFCPGMACGMYSNSGTYVIEGNKVIAIFTSESSEDGEGPLNEPWTADFTIKDQNTLEYNGQIFNYQETFW